MGEIIWRNRIKKKWPEQNTSTRIYIQPEKPVSSHKTKTIHYLNQKFNMQMKPFSKLIQWVTHRIRSGTQHLKLVNTLLAVKKLITSICQSVGWSIDTLNHSVEQNLCKWYCLTYNWCWESVYIQDSMFMQYLICHSNLELTFWTSLIIKITASSTSSLWSKTVSNFYWLLVIISHQDNFVF